MNRRTLREHMKTAAAALLIVAAYAFALDLEQRITAPEIATHARPQTPDTHALATTD